MNFLFADQIASDPCFKSQVNAFFLEIGQLLDQVILHRKLFKVIDEDWDKQVQEDELAKDQQCEEEDWWSNRTIRVSVVTYVDSGPAVIS